MRPAQTVKNNIRREPKKAKPGKPAAIDRHRSRLEHEEMLDDAASHGKPLPASSFPWELVIF